RARISRTYVRAVHPFICGKSDASLEAGRSDLTTLRTNVIRLDSGARCSVTIESLIDRLSQCTVRPVSLGNAERGVVSMDASHSRKCHPQRRIELQKIPGSSLRFRLASA